ncbi:hypothetical protein [Escherichia coli]|uniref:hypothetical protein n=1 Tax=Escherichia coli TaxID=562 RepID=UPI0013E90240|nr:hypothetical protein [Escherichia coli]
MTFSLSYEQLTRFAEKRIRECNLDSHGSRTTTEAPPASASSEPCPLNIRR